MPGAVPGQLVPHPHASDSKIHVIQYDEQNCDSRELKAGDIKQLMRAKSKGDDVTWIDVKGLGSVQLIHEIGEAFGLHPLALEDIVNVHQRPKVEMYGDHLFVIARSHIPGTLDSEQVAMFLGRDFVVTFQEDNVDCLQPVRRRIESAQGRIRERKADYLLYALIDVVVDGYFPALEDYGERLDALDDRI